MVQLLGFFFIMCLLSILFCIVVVGTQITKSVKRKTNHIEIPKTSHRSVKKIMNDLEATSRLHRSLGNQSLQKQSKELLGSVIVLSKAIETQASPVQIRMIETTLLEKLERLIVALGEDHYVSMVKTPHHWEDADEQKVLVRTALATMKSNVDATIVELYADRTLESKVNLETILGNESPAVQDFYREVERPEDK